MHFDPVADIITKINNANRAKIVELQTEASKLKVAILNILLNEGYIRGYEIYDNKEKTKSILKIKLKFDENRVSSLNGMKQISKPGLRIYVSAEKLPKVLNGLGIAIVSTNEGLMTDKLARAKKIGGEVLAYVW
ncbi:30S ribosomal protein S8 [Mycoplasmoides gallisepticum CA06_2006.052-5-2P]|uniref:Small ribosomal subunit protein uS8 n=2 Tax=Mycoplasmoides gallisepticum TaxID=2096 RepID=A0AB36DSB9_MYCGL|nr:30S ribosomal protein S8 [Mycoplasmoides gallisepticum]AFP75703.1 30S ribosomal protein S8 [Mycoplasmoides gallisepticum VA94_7994-1-7P]AFP76470.1 30S ribosomal protein S8 [Mycoplasmoides gallisepticum NC95_13295-2-2P]AFP77224.1 30S ribosomal protein S8 [Mycoplasmoides gallisepticum NC96_1596-4-2P]AFP77995.1 30S ribosomal protein S8 [Mycoplasmoides gallisepticum NY01_2001.047-5-1P]AFP78755.1 30S ribosomal protein S8 [Mycoplasmoides gallisepticum WI01_2001.043-13-2P]